MKKLESRLSDFSSEQLRKFQAIAYKHPKDSVTDDELDWSTMPMDSLLAHMKSEIEEWGARPGDETELVDIANMAFLLWARIRYND